MTSLPNWARWVIVPTGVLALIAAERAGANLSRDVLHMIFLVALLWDGAATRKRVGALEVRLGTDR